LAEGEAEVFAAEPGNRHVGLVEVGGQEEWVVGSLLSSPPARGELQAALEALESLQRAGRVRRTPVGWQRLD